MHYCTEDLHAYSHLFLLIIFEPGTHRCFAFSSSFCGIWYSIEGLSCGTCTPLQLSHGPNIYKDTKPSAFLKN
jgi:hypothetical protein